jgi:hypothetical protein
MAGEVTLDSAKAYHEVQSSVAQRFQQTITLTAVRTGAAHVELRCGKTGNESVVAFVGSTKLIAVKVTP